MDLKVVNAAVMYWMLDYVS